MKVAGEKIPERLEDDYPGDRSGHDFRYYLASGFTVCDEYLADPEPGIDIEALLDGPAAAALSATGDYGPLLLLESPDAIPAPLGAYLSDLQPGSPPSGPVHGVYNHGWVIGDTSAISAATQASLDGRLEIAPRAAPEAPLSSATSQSEGP